MFVQQVGHNMTFRCTGRYLKVTGFVDFENFSNVGAEYSISGVDLRSIAQDGTPTPTNKSLNDEQDPSLQAVSFPVSDPLSNAQGFIR